MTRFFMLLMLLISFSITGANAGIISKTAKAVVVAKVAQKVAPAVTKKLARKEASKKLAQEALLKNELKVGKYRNLVANRPFSKKSGQQTETLDAHHMPSTKYIESKGIPRDQGVAMEMQPSRHMQTRTYGNNAVGMLNETPRQALGRDIKDAKKVYEQNGVYNPKVRKSLQQVVTENKKNYPNLYNK